MEFNENRAGKPFKQSPFRLMFILPYRLLKAWQLRYQTRKVLSTLNAAQLRDIGLTCEDVRRYK
mgnify:CR=1 FL=1